MLARLNLGIGDWGLGIGLFVVIKFFAFHWHQRGQRFAFARAKFDAVRGNGGGESCVAVHARFAVKVRQRQRDIARRQNYCTRLHRAWASGTPSAWLTMNAARLLVLKKFDLLDQCHAFGIERAHGKVEGCVVRDRVMGS